LVPMAERPLLAIVGRGPVLGSLLGPGGKGPPLGQRERGPIVGALLRMTPEARGAFIRDAMIDTLAWMLGIGAGRLLMRLLEMNIREFLGEAAGRRGG